MLAAVWAIGSCVCTVLLFLLLDSRGGLVSSGPRYDGRDLDSWLGDIDDNRPIRRRGPLTAPASRDSRGYDEYVDADWEAREAIRAMGTNAIPELLRRLRVKKSGLRSKRRVDRMHQQGYEGLRALESAAKPAVPALLRMLDDDDPTNDHAVAGSLLIQALHEARDLMKRYEDSDSNHRVVRAKGGSEDAKAALSELCETYYAPALAFVRAWIRNDDKADDLTQEFFAKVLKGGAFDNAAPERGRFR